MKGRVLLLIVIGFCIRLSAQNVTKPAIDSVAIEHWPAVSVGATITNDGKYFLYYIENLPVGNNTLVVRSTADQWKRSIADVRDASFTGDSKRIVIQLAGDSLCILQLGSGDEQWIKGISRYQLSGKDWLAGEESGPDKRLRIFHVGDTAQQMYTSVNSYWFNHRGNMILVDEQTTDSMDLLKRIDLINGSVQVIGRGREIEGVLFSADDSGIAFQEMEREEGRTSKTIWYYRQGDEMAHRVVGNGPVAGDSNWVVDNGSLFFDRAGSRLFFHLKQRMVQSPRADIVPVDIWNYKDGTLQAVQLSHKHPPTSFLAVVNLHQEMSEKDRVIQIETPNQVVMEGVEIKDFPGKYVIVKEPQGTDRDYRLKIGSPMPVLYRLSLSDGSREPMRLNVSFADQPILYTFFSAEGRWMVYYSVKNKAYYSYDIQQDSIQMMTRDIPVPLTNENDSLVGMPSEQVAGIGAWLQGDSSVLVYDNYDIWEVDPSGSRRSVNLTNGYGRRHHIQFRLVESLHGDWTGDRHAGLLLSAFNEDNKYTGFYSKMPDRVGDPTLLTMGPYKYFHFSINVYGSGREKSFMPTKAADTDKWIVCRESSVEAPNFYLTTDLKEFTAISDLEPQRQYNWLTAELVKWRTTDGSWSQGILYKPENMDTSHQYPIIFQFYGRVSDGMYDYPQPAYNSGDINIAYYVSRGYAVFLPDIYYKIRETGESVKNAVVSAAKYLTKTRPWIDVQRMGINGQSFGGYEVNYLVTHTHIFAAAAECCGVSDIISEYGSLPDDYDYNFEHYGYFGYYHMGVTLWQAPDAYIRNSPIFRADKVTTPLLILHNKKDPAVMFSPQATEWFTALWRLNKKAWLLQYDHWGHGVAGIEKKDFSIRLAQFFDYYLMGKLPPKWMTVGIPAERKGTETGYELDNSGEKP